MKRWQQFTLELFGPSLLWAGFLFGAVAVWGGEWVNDPHFYSGLFTRCNFGRFVIDCVEVEATPWLNAVRSLMIIMLIMVAVGTCVDVVARWKECKNLAYYGIAIYMAAGLLGAVGMIVFTSYPRPISSSLGLTYAVGWVSVVYVLLSASLGLVYTHHLTEEEYSKITASS